MEKKDRQLLIKDLSARLSYGVRIREYNDKYGWSDGVLSTITNDYFSEGEPSIEGNWINRAEDVRPYLRPLSSITDSELYDAAAIMLGGVPYKKADGSWYTISHDPFFGEIEQDLDFDYFSKGYYGIKNVDFLNKHHFDYRGLIEKGLALEAPDGMYNTKTEQL